MNYHVATLPNGTLAFRAADSRVYVSVSLDGLSWSTSLGRHPVREVRIVDRAEFNRLKREAAAEDPKAARKHFANVKRRISNNEYDAGIYRGIVAAIDGGGAEFRDHKNGFCHIQVDRPADFRLSRTLQGSNLSEARAYAENAAKRHERLAAKAQADLAKLEKGNG